MPNYPRGEERHGLLWYHGCHQKYFLAPETELEGMAGGEAFLDLTMISSRHLLSICKHVEYPIGQCRRLKRHKNLPAKLKRIF